MRNTLATFLFLLPMLIGAACDQNTPTPSNVDQSPITENTISMKDTLIIKVGDKEFTANLLDNPTATAFKQCCH